MPTGWTADVVDGKVTDLRTYALQCARAMGALIMMRDSPHDAPIPERFEPGTYNAERLAEAKAERDRLNALSEAEAEAAAEAEYAERVAAKEKWQTQRTEARNRYNAMIAKVIQWDRAPEGLKEFMLEQLHRGRDFDCPEGERYYGQEPERITGAEWRRQKLEKVHKDIEYNAVEDAKERERTESRNVWIAQLRASLPPASAIEARSDATPKSGAARQGESAASETGDAQVPHPLVSDPLDEGGQG